MGTPTPIQTAKDWMAYSLFSISIFCLMFYPLIMVFACIGISLSLNAFLKNQI